VILHEKNLDGEATVALNRALYLDPSFVLAHVTLGNLMRRGGKEKAARRCFDNARDILRREHRDMVLPESGGMTAGRLLHMISTPQESAA
jgi:chemotaxis protein methyltransferase CheR